MDIPQKGRYICSTWATNRRRKKINSDRHGDHQESVMTIVWRGRTLWLCSFKDSPRRWSLNLSVFNVPTCLSFYFQPMKSSKTEAGFLELYSEFYSWFPNFYKPKSLAKVIIWRLHSILKPNPFSLHNFILPSCGQMSPSSFPGCFSPFASQIYHLRLYHLGPFQLFAHLILPAGWSLHCEHL